MTWTNFPIILSRVVKRLNADTWNLVSSVQFSVNIQFEL